VFTQELARLLPSLAHARRLSKSIIVNESISYLNTQRAIRLAAANEVRKLLADYDSLLTVLNNRQHPYVPADIQQLPPRPVSEALLNLLGVEQEEFGTFPGGFGDNRPGDEVEDEQAGESDYFVAQRNNNDSTNLSDEPPNFLLSEPNSLMNATAPVPDFTAMQLPLDMLATNTTYESDPQQGDLDPSHQSTIFSSSIFGDITTSNEDLPGNLLSRNGWSIDMYSEPAFHGDSDSTQLLYSNSVFSSQFHEQHPPMVENTSYGFLP
jgi:hypothetical protein